MKILADANPVYSGQLTGIGYYTDELLAHLASKASVEGFAFNYKNKKHVELAYTVQEQTKLPGKLLSYPRYAKVDLPLSAFFKISDADVVMGTNYLLPPTGKIPNVVTVHDMCFIDHPEWVQGRNAHIMRTMLGKTLDRSCGLITISEFSKSRIVDIYGYDKPILVVSIPPKKSKAGSTKPELINNVSAGSYFLFISTIEPRKNIKTLLDAFEQLPHSVQAKYPLVLGGKPGWDPETLDRLASKKNKNIHYLDYVTETERNWLYQNATVTVVPSHYEGFGMMTLESLDKNTPVIASDILPHREILGDAGAYFKPLDTSKLTSLLNEFTHAKTRDEYLKKQLPVLGNHSWEKTAGDVLTFLKGFQK